MTTAAPIPRPLPESLPAFDKARFVQLKRHGNLALYGLLRPNGKFSTYEVIRIQVKQPERVFGKDYPLRETYPCTSSWGRQGWTYQHLANAEAAFAKLVNRS